MLAWMSKLGGSETPKPDIDLIRERLEAAQAHA
jgi:hypothetical protein